MPQPGQFGIQGDDWLVREVQTLRRELNELRAANPFAAMGIRPMPDGLIVEGYETVNGPMEVNGPLEVNGDSEFNGPITINGAAAITGTLSLPAGIINNDALANPVQYTAGFNDNEALTITLTDTTICSYSFTVPAGFSQAFVVAYGSIGIVNPTGANSSIGGRVYIDRPYGAPSTWGPRRFQQALAGADAATYPYKQTIVTGLSGGETITCRMTSMNSGSTDWGATVGGASLNVSAYFTR